MTTNDQDSSLTLVQAPTEPIRVLLLDDHPDNLLLRSTILRKYGYVTSTASTIEPATTQRRTTDHVSRSIAAIRSAERLVTRFANATAAVRTADQRS